MGTEGHVIGKIVFPKRTQGRTLNRLWRTGRIARDGVRKQFCLFAVFLNDTVPVALITIPAIATLETSRIPLIVSAAIETRTVLPAAALRVVLAPVGVILTTATIF